MRSALLLACLGLAARGYCAESPSFGTAAQPTVAVEPQVQQQRAGL